MRAKAGMVFLLFLCGAVCHAQRLPEGVVPIHYTLSFTPDIPAARFAGHEKIQVHLLRPTDAITLNAADIQFNAVTVQTSEGRQEAHVALDPSHQTATLQLTNAVAAGDAELEIDFTGILNDKLRGFYLVQGKTRNYASTQFEATDARRAFPAFDEPALKATFDISLTVDEGDIAISNGAIVSDTPGPGPGKHTLQFAPTPKMSTYLVAMLVGDWKCIEGGSDGIPIRICATPDKIGLVGFALKSSEHILHSLNQYYGIPYPYKKLDIIAVPDFEAGAMENLGAITFREILLLVDEQHSSVGARRGVAEVLAHEIAHMWFGDLVTMKWWDDLWLNEGFATWMVSKPVGDWKPEWRESLQDVQNASGTLDVDSSPATRQIRAKASTPDEINELFDGIAYGKAAAVLHMVEQYLGPEVFRAGVKQYLETYAHGNATAEDFWNTLAEVSKQPMDKIMASFVDQPGVPMVSVRSHCSDGKTIVEATQRRFYLVGSLMDAPSPETWTIPVCFKMGEARDCRIVDQKQQEFTFDGCYAEFSADASGSGYYRTQYSGDTFRHLPGNSWNAGQRDRLVGDSWALVQAGKQSVGEYLDLLRRMGADPERVVFESEIQPLPTIAENLTNPEGRAALSALIRDLAEPGVKRLGWSPAPGEGDDDRQLRPVLIALLGNFGNDSKVLQQAAKSADRYLRDRSSLDASLAPTVLSLAARTGGPALYARYLDAARRAKSPEEFLNFLFGLVAFSEPELVQRTLEMAVSPEVRSQDSPYLLVALLSRPATRKRAWSWAKQHWTEIQARFTFSSGSRVVEATGSFCDPADREDVQGFFASHPVESSERTLSLALHRIDACIELRSRQSQNLSVWLDNAKTNGNSKTGGGRPRLAN
ncbi:MAG: Peptidase rane alanine aminopeptidase [Edaphobacter sp.]|nr:Peptidase rane alanine aminopeptidase [Edaphobacter sp.]